MPKRTRAEIQEYIEELEGRAAESQANAKHNLNQLFDREHGRRPPRDFVDSSFLYMRACDADIGSRPVNCPVFWVSPDLRVAPLANLGMPTHQLTAGTTYRFTATVRNRGDLPVPSAKVEFFIVNPSLGFDTRFATKLGVAADRVQAHGMGEVSLDYTIPPSMAGHRCLFARVFSFSPLDLPIDDIALNPLIDRHVAQVNLNVIAQVATLVVDWFHLPNAEEQLELVPMTAPMIRALRAELATSLTLVSAARWREVQGALKFDATPAEGPAIEVRQTDAGLELVSSDREALPIERQAELKKRVQAAVRALETGRGNAARFKELFNEFRAMNAKSVRTQVAITLPDVGLARRQGVAVNVIRHDSATGAVTGGIALLIVSADRLSAR